MIWKLFLAHVITDFILQAKKMAIGKLVFKNNLLHCLILFIISSVFLMNQLTIKLILMLITISILHGFIDYGKAFVEKKAGGKWNWLLFSGDQVLHILFIFIILGLFYPLIIQSYLSKFVVIVNSTNIFKTALFFIIISFGGSYFTASVCKGFNPNKEDKKSKEEKNSLDKAGRYIGILERIIIVASILIGRYEIIGFLIAAKSIIRHPEQKDKAFAEYFLIGTFTSFIWAAFFTFLYLKL
ncbi:MAG: DUF3307 domain-containing protein [Candidatus Tenebribacter burtonii]|jgi:hypothetical protein|nr:DUF3307 domain-containing protein [Candidatus Tenebribacter burtonii]